MVIDYDHGLTPEEFKERMSPHFLKDPKPLLRDLTNQLVYYEKLRILVDNSENGANFYKTISEEIEFLRQEIGEERYAKTKLEIEYYRQFHEALFPDDTDYRKTYFYEGLKNNQFCVKRY